MWWWSRDWASIRSWLCDNSNHIHIQIHGTQSSSDRPQWSNIIKRNVRKETTQLNYWLPTLVLTIRYSASIFFQSYKGFCVLNGHTLEMEKMLPQRNQKYFAYGMLLWNILSDYKQSDLDGSSWIKPKKNVPNSWPYCWNIAKSVDYVAEMLNICMRFVHQLHLGLLLFH